MAHAQPGAPNAHIHPLTPPPPLAFSFAHDARDEAEPGEAAYVMLQSREPVDASECEDPLLEAVEVTVLWGGTVLHVAHLAPPRPFYVGHGDGVDYLLPAELAPFARASIVDVDGGVRPLAPTGAVLAGDEVRFGEIAFRVTRVTAGKRVPRALGADTRGLGGAFAVSVASVAAFLGAIAYYTPALGASLDGDFDRDSVEAMRVYLNAQAERERERQLDQNDKSAEPEGGGTPGEAARGPEGKMGRPDRPSVNKRTAIAGGGELTLPREAALQAARTFGLVGMLSSMNARALPSAAWGADVATGPDASDAWGELFGKEPGESGGLGGLGLSGSGQGGGGLGAGIGLGTGGVCNPNCGVGLGGTGIGHSFGGTGPGHHPTGPRVAWASPPTTSGHLPAEVIQRVVRQNYGRFRSCYESGLMSNPNLTGRVTARFVIGRDGAVSNASNGGSDLPDSKVVSCVLSQFYGITFPPPEAGIVTVSYPIMFTPG
ncbi:MAG TPA: AgmX/PglI C-terminal domain-containing protein [Polyangiaceae bacterium]|nr:AgmX/PglI C-terminal domain-containing protein [Polyangiaceae bacterium]